MTCYLHSDFDFFLLLWKILGFHLDARYSNSNMCMYVCMGICVCACVCVVHDVCCTWCVCGLCGVVLCGAVCVYVYWAFYGPSQSGNLHPLVLEKLPVLIL